MADPTQESPDRRLDPAFQGIRAGIRLGRAGIARTREAGGSLGKQLSQGSRTLNRKLDLNQRNSTSLSIGACGRRADLILAAFS
jgi:hypothetical protein